MNSRVDTVKNATISLFLLLASLFVVFAIEKFLVPHGCFDEESFKAMFDHPVRGVPCLEMSAFLIGAGVFIVNHVTHVKGYLDNTKPQNTESQERSKGILFFIALIISCALLIVSEKALGP